MKKRTKTWLRIVALLLALLLLGSTLYVILDSVIMSAGAVSLDELNEQQVENRRVCGNCYCTEYLDYIFVNGLGKIYHPEHVSQVFRNIIEENGFRKIRFHDLRHSCASLLLANGVSLKEIQEWLGHSDIATTADIYSHLDFKSKISSANLMDGVLNLPEPVIREDWGVQD